MGYVDQNLVAGETIVYRGKLHWFRYFWAGTWVFLGLLFFAAPEKQATVLFLGLGLILGLAAYLDQVSSEFVVTTKRLYLKQGLIRRRTVELMLSKIESVQVDQGIIGRMLGFGSIMPGGSGGTKQAFKKIADPLAFRRAVNEQIEGGSSAGVAAAGA